LKIRHFIGHSENAVRIQIAVALIAFLLLRIAQSAQFAVCSPLRFAEAVRTNLMHRKPLDRLLATDHHTKPQNDIQQMELQWS
jgi:hypothetical protein